jgi:hypothetical protein
LGYGLSDRVLAKQARGPEFKAPINKKIDEIIKWMNI